MKAVIQRVSNASVSIQGKTVGKIKAGLLVLLGVNKTDTSATVSWLSKKIANLRIFGDEEGKMNHSVLDVNGDILLISQFTLHANTKKGNRPSFIEAAPPKQAIALYQEMILALESQLKKPIQTGEFGASMQVNLLNDGPVTIIIDTDEYLIN